MNLSPSSWKLELLGSGELYGPDGQTLRPERKTLALLAYLALEGRTPRGKLAGLLWPDTPESAARNNLVHLLKRLKSNTGAELINPQTHLELSPMLWVDVLEVLAQPAAALNSPLRWGILLHHLDFDDCPDLDDWLHSQRERLGALHSRTLREQAEAAEQHSDFPQAIHWAEAVLEHDPLSEDAYRHLMRLHARLGDRSSALRVYERCTQTLERELGVLPLPETQRLARELEGGNLPQPLTPVRWQIPLSVLRPPTLVGREAAWARMQAAWQAGKGIILIGDPGTGKTRLMQDFLAAHGGGMIFPSRPGDAGILYGTHARTFRQIWQAYPDLPLEPWVRFEVSRILPQLNPDHIPPPLVLESDRLRFWQAKSEMIMCAVRAGMRNLALDDCQYMDIASVQAGEFGMSSRGWGTPAAEFRTLHSFRKNLLRPEVAEVLYGLARAGIVDIIELEPLNLLQLEGLLAQFETPNAPNAHAQLVALHQFSGGNPLFVLEIMRSLFEAGHFVHEVVHGNRTEANLQRGWPNRLPLPDTVRSIILERTSHLSHSALHAARAAAVLQSDFSLEQVAEVLGSPLLEVAEAWEELERVQVMAGEAFSHDLLYEAIHSDLPPTIKRLLHRSAARVLTRGGGNAARIARHWLEGGEQQQAALWMTRAADQAEAELYFSEAGELLEQAATALEGLGKVQELQQVRERQQKLLVM
jgi:DNA-binding SARP family transcriptional activator